jgi:PAS domain S-box-containing protein
VTVTDLEGIITHVSQRALVIHGVDDAGILIGKSALELIAPEDHELALANLQKTLEGEIIRNAQYTLLQHDGSRFSGELSAALVRDAHGNPKAFISTVRDITQRLRSVEERARVEVALRAEKEKAQQYLDVAGVAIVAFDSGGRITLINRRGLDILGYEEEELIGQHWVDTCLPERVRGDVAQVFEQLTQGQVEAAEYYENPVVTKSGEERVIAWHNTVIRDTDGIVVGILSSGEDITERIRSQQERSRAEDALALRVEQLAALSQASQTVTASLELDRVLAEIVSLAREVVTTDYTSVILMNDEGSMGRSVENIPGISALEYRVRDDGFTSWIVQSHQPLIVDEIQEDGTIMPQPREGAPLTANPPVVQAGIKSAAGLPLIIKDRLMGILYLHSLHAYAFHDQLPLLTAFANQVAIAIENARLFETAQQELAERKRAEAALRQYTERLRVLHTIDEAILAAWSPEEIANAALRHLHKLVPCESVYVSTLDFESQEALVFAAYPKDKSLMSPGTRLPLESVTEIETLRQGHVLIEKDLSIYSQPPPAMQAMLAAGVRSYMAAPLISQEGLVGVLTIIPDGPILPEIVDIASEVAGQLSMALYQARLRAALESEQKRLKTLVEHLPEGVLLLDGERRILLANPVAESYLQALTGSESPLALTSEVLKDLGGWPTEELSYAAPEGLWRELEIAGPPERVFGIAAQPVGAASQAEGWVLLVWDVTHEREVERQNRQQERLAAVGQLAGGIAHDFNNLLTTILLYSQMLLHKPHLPPDLVPSVETIITESQRAARLVQQILDFGRRAMMETEPVDLVSFVEEAFDILRRTFPESIRLIIELESDAYIVKADPTRIQQVLMNLAVNARDAMPQGGELRIELSCIELDTSAEPPVEEMTAGKWVRMAISDTGTGIPPDVLPHVFEPFFTTKPPGEGTGLGLAQVYGIVKQHEGHIAVETQVGEGTIVQIYLPAHETERVSGAEQEAATPPAGKGETILLVEDEEKLREISESMLETLGYHVLTATDGREALEVFQAAETVDLVITDLVMPVMGGRELLHELNRVEPGVKAVAITGYALTTQREELKEAGILDIIRKPFDVNSLGRTVRHVLDADH